MARIVVYCNTPEEGALVRKQLIPILEEWEEPPFYREFTENRTDFLRYVSGNPYLTILVVQSGPEGKETVRLTKQTNPKAGIIWFASENYALDAFAFHIAHFSPLPLNREKLKSAFNAGQMSRDGPYTSTVTV